MEQDSGGPSQEELQRQFLASERNLSAAGAAHEAHRTSQGEMFASVLEFGHAAIRSATILNGGAAVATLAFVGALLTSPRTLRADYLPIVDVLITYGVGVALAGASAAVGYLAQYSYQFGLAGWRRTLKPPYLVATNKTRLWNGVGFCFHALTLIAVILAYGLFLRGGWEFAQFARRLLPLLNH